tara:strand:+ start:69 stop:374 length:306 start_codon:yes stop_codon:yes gene_type:complete
MAAEKSVTERILSVLHPYAAHWGGTLNRGDLGVPRPEILRMIHEIIDITPDTSGGQQEASDLDLFQVLSETRRLPLVQDQIDRLKADFQISKNKPLFFSIV